VGDGLEMYVVLAKGRGPQGLEGIRGMSEITTAEEGERVFLIQRDLKKD
jgi:20S proteasome subunit beta 6